MALETLKGIATIGGYRVMEERPLKKDGSVDWTMFDEHMKYKPIYIDHDVNMISFRFQDGPIKEAGLNGCQVDTLIHAARVILSGLNAKYPCRENALAITKLEEAVHWLNARTAN